MNGWFASEAQQLEAIQAGDGKVLLESGVQAMVEAMAAFAPPAAGETSLSPTLSSQLAATLAANCQ